MSGYWICSADGVIVDAAGARFDGWARTWSDPKPLPGDAVAVSASEAVAWLFARPDCRQVPVGVIGPRHPSATEYATAEALGRALGALHLTVLTGGHGGVMEAACRGVRAAGGQTLALLPDDGWQAANDHVAVPLATGIGSARNALIARACLALVAVGGGYGTLSEMAFGLHFDRPVLTLGAAPTVPGAVPCADVSAAIDRLLPVLLARR